MIKTLHKWHQSKPGLLIFGLIEVAIAYGFAGLAIDRGNFLWYLLALLFFVGFLQNVFKLIGILANGDRKKR